MPVITAKDITLAELESKFGLQLEQHSEFFLEWQRELPSLSPHEIQNLHDVRAEFLRLSRYPLLESLIKMVIVSPLLRIGGFYEMPFYLAAEQEIELASEDEGTLVRGRIDILTFQPEFWVLVIEAKQPKFSLEAGIPQALAYMLARPTPQKAILGMVTNGFDYIFLKITQKQQPVYGLSYPFSIRRNGDLDTVAAIVKKASLGGNQLLGRR